MRLRSCLGVSLLAVFGLYAGSAESSLLFVGSGGSAVRITSFEIDGSGAKTVVSGGAGSGSVVGLAADPLLDDLYYVVQNNPDRSFFRDNDPGTLDPTLADRDTLFDFASSINANNPGAVAIDPGTRQAAIAFTRVPPLTASTTRIRQQSLDGGGLTDRHSLGEFTLQCNSLGFNCSTVPVHSFRDVVVDPLAHQVYFTDRFGGTISRLALDGSGGVQTIFSGLQQPNGLAFDAGTGDLYWTELGPSDRIRTANGLDPGAPITLYTSASGNLGDIDVDPFNETLFWIEDGVVRTSDLAGGNVSDFINTGTGSAVSGSTLALNLDRASFPGTDQDNPVLPTDDDPGQFDFNRTRRGSWIDPPFADGFLYRMLSDSLFTAILDFPTGFDQPFTVSLTDGTLLGSFGPGESVDFTGFVGGGVAEFIVSGISPLADAADPLAFPLQIDFNTEFADFQMLAQTVSQTSTSTPAPTTLALLALALAPLGCGRRRRRGRTRTTH